MTNLIYFLVFLMMFLFIGKTHFTLSPFSFYMERPGYALGWLLIYAGITLLIGSTHMEAYERGIQQGIELQKEQDEPNTTSDHDRV